MQDSRGLFVLVALLLLVTMGPCQQPDDVPDPPPPVSTLAGRVKQLAQQLVPAAHRAKATALAGEYRRLAAVIARLQDPLTESDLNTPEAAIAASNAAARISLGASWDAWQPFYRQLYTELNQAAQQPDADRTVYGVGKTFAAIAEGFDDG